MTWIESLNIETGISAWRKGWPLLYSLFVTAALFVAFSHWAYDDPYITYRYAQNISHGLGMVYNPGDRILSTTTPLFTLLLALLSFLWSDLPHLANLIGAFSLSLGGLFLWDLSRSWKTPLVGWAGLLLYPTFPAVVSTLGSETPLYLALCLGAFVFYVRQRYAWTGVFAALAVLTRPDGILVAAVLAVDYLLRIRQSIPWRGMLLFLGLTASWFIFSWAYFGSPLPVTLATKQHQGLMIISQRFAPGFVSLARSYANYWIFWLEGILALAGVLFLAWRARPWRLLLSWTVLYFVAYSALGVTSYFWYYAPLVPGFVVLVGLGAGASNEWLSSNGKRFAMALPLALLVLPLLFQARNLWEMRQHPDSRVQVYQAIGKWLRNNTPSDATVGTLEVGIIGYYARRPMVDFAGLIQPEVAAQLLANTTYEDAALWATQHYHPEYLVLHSGIFPRLEQGYAAENCQVVKRFPGKTYNYSTNLDVYACR